MIHLIKTSERASGDIILTSKDTGFKIREETRRCVHCRYTWVVGSKLDRKLTGWCFNCNDVTCGRKECGSCRHYMKKIEAVEKAGRYPKVF